MSSVENAGFVIGAAATGHWENSVVWAQAVSSGWKQILSNAYLPGAIKLAGGLNLSLRGSDALLTADATISSGGDIIIKADDVDLHAGAGSLIGTHSLTIQTYNAAQNYYIGTAAEAASGYEVLRAYRTGYMEFSSRDLTAIATTFSSQTFGADATTGIMVVGDMKDGLVSKMTASTRPSGSAVDASNLAGIHNTTFFLADTLRIEGNVNATLDAVTLTARILQ
jgi:hypothetical protein